MIGFVDVLTEYSCLQSTLRLDDYISFLVANKYEIATITDYNLVGHYKLYKKAKANNLKPLIGLKLLINSNAGRKNYINAYALNEQGYHNLIKFASIMEMRGIIADEEVIKYNEGIALVTTAFDSDLEYYLGCFKHEELEQELARLQSLTENLFIGIHVNSFQYDTVCYDLVDFIEEHDLRALPLSTSAYFKQEENVYQDLLKIGDIKEKDADLSLKNKEELMLDYQDVDFVFEDLNYFVSLFEDFEIKSENSIPKFFNRQGMSSEDYLRDLCLKGLQRRLVINKLESKKQEYLDRLNYELDIIHKMGYEDYILIVFEYVYYAKKNNIYVGPGRGSACSSLVVYSLGICEIDPLKYDLYFERFLNPERVSMPDIDIDFEDQKREEVIEHLASRYGRNHVSYITTFQTFQAKNSLRELFRIKNVDLKYINSAINALELSLEELKDSFSLHPELIDIVLEAKKLEGLPRAFSTHPSGIIITSHNMYNDIPLKPGTGSIYQSMLTQDDLEELGYLKFDFLSVSYMTFMREMLDRINETEKFNINNIRLYDKKTFDLLASGDTLGIFQIEGKHYTEFVKEMKMSTFDDLIALLALYRPGPIDMIPVYIRRKLGEPFNYLDDSLKPILSGTYGIIVYQEQVMKILQVIAKYSLGEADLFRRAIAKKNIQIMEEKKDDFISRGLSNGYQKEVLVEIYNQIQKFSEYGFNKTHSVAYALFVYQLAYLKANYKEVFIACSLEKQKSNKLGISTIINLANMYNIPIYSPDINVSSLRYEKHKDGLIMPLNCINLVGDSVAKSIIDNRENGYTSFEDFLIKNELDKEILKRIVFSNAFDNFGLTKLQMINMVNNSALKFLSKEEIVYTDEEFDSDTLMNEELASINCNIKYNLFNDYEKYKAEYKAKDVNELQEANQIVNIIGIIQGYRVFERKDQSQIYFYDVLVKNEKIEVNVFDNLYEQFKDALASKKLVVIRGKVNIYKGKVSLNLIKLKEL